MRTAFILCAQIHPFAIIENNDIGSINGFSDLVLANSFAVLFPLLNSAMFRKPEKGDSVSRLYQFEITIGKQKQSSSITISDRNIVIQIIVKRNNMACNKLSIIVSVIYFFI